MKIRIGTRKSLLALKQADIVANYLLGLDEVDEIEIVDMSTSGDLNQNINWKNSKESLKGLFTMEIEDKLLTEEIDIAVHSLKDMPSELKPGLVVASYLDMVDNSDVLLTLNNKTLKELPIGSTIGTSSRRREVNILKQRDDLQIKPIRGNINTRIKKLENKEYDAIVLAAAGLERLKLTDYISEYFDVDEFIPAPGQGILGIEAKVNHPIVAILKKYEDKYTVLKASLEREFATIFDGGCTTPVGCYVTKREDKIYMKGFYVNDGIYYQASAYSNIYHDTPLSYIVSNKIKSLYQDVVGRVKLVGAGPGDVELLTLKAYNAIKNADIIFYDRLVNPQIIDLSDAIKISVGKTNHDGGTSQAKINQMLVDAAFKYQNIVRLKGGDPFIFGRAYEECEVLEKYKIKYDIIPGISAFSGAAGYSNLPITMRGVSSGFEVYSGVSNLNYELIAQSKETLFFYMSVREGENVSKNLIANGYKEDASCAYIENATLKDQRIIKFKLKDLKNTIEQKNIKAPAILMISPNIDYALNYNWFTDTNKIKIMSTREDKHFASFKAKFADEKYEVVNLSQIEIKLLNNKVDLTNIETILFNSVNSVKSLINNVGSEVIKQKNICVVGLKTKQVLEENGISVDYISSEPTMNCLIREVRETYDQEILVCTSKEVAPKLQGIKNIYIGYETNNVNYEYEFVKDTLLTTNVVCFFSASAVNSFMNNINYNYELLNNIKIIVLGITTNKALECYNLSADIISKEATQEGLISEVKGFYENI